MTELIPGGTAAAGRESEMNLKHRRIGLAYKIKRFGSRFDMTAHLSRAAAAVALISRILIALGQKSLHSFYIFLNFRG